MSARSLRWAVALSSSLAASGCYWSSQPSTPHRDVAVDLAAIPELRLPRPRALQGSRIVVLGRFDSSAPQPIGGLYDKHEYEISPLYRTYFFKDGAVEVFEHVSDGLRASGLVVLKDYAGHADPSMLEAPLRARAPMLVSATVTALQHDQIREKGANQDWEAGRLAIDLRVTDTSGAVRLAKSYLVEGRAHFDGQTELLRLLGWKLAEALAADPQFVAAVGAQAGG
ncbi:MAG: hypothetical protein NVS3B10_12030 [Polyangiales bacterium]